MSAAQTADRIVAHCYSSSDGMAAGTDQLATNLADRSIPVIVADNVAAYVNTEVAKGREYAVGSWPCLAPPWDWAFIEYPSHSGRERRGCYVIGFDLLKASPEEVAQVNGIVGAAVDDAAQQSPGEVVRWALVMCMYADDGHRVHGPMGTLVYVLDAYGKELGNRWFLRPDATWTEADHDGALWLNAAALPALQTIAFMHCKNVVVDRAGRPTKLAKAYERRHGAEPLRWQTVRLELPRTTTDGDASRPGSGPSLHIVTGHFAHYGNCCPTQHEPNGKLFGRLEGIYWSPQHARGNPQREVRSDRVVTLGVRVSVGGNQK